MGLESRSLHLGRLLLLGSVLLAVGCTGTSRQVTDNLGDLGGQLFNHGSVHVTTRPSGAFISINEKKYGRSPLAEALPEGSHLVKARKKGYETQEVWVDVTRGQRAQVQIELKERK